MREASIRRMANDTDSYAFSYKSIMPTRGGPRHQKLIMYKYFFMLLPFILLVSCSNDEPESEMVDRNSRDNYERFQNWYTTLMDTSWKLQSSMSYYDDGTVKDNTLIPSSDEKSFYDKYLSTVMTLTSVFENNRNEYILQMSTIPGAGGWWISDDGELAILSSYNNGNPSKMEASDMGRFVRFFPEGGGKIVECSPNSLVLERDHGYGIRTVYVFSRVYGYTPEEGGGSGGSGSNYELPEIGLEDYTGTTTSITVKYRIYNQSEASVTSATGYYGTSSPTKKVSATVNGSLITIRFTSLSRGTTYYIKCTAKGGGGTTTSETTRLSTLY